MKSKLTSYLEKAPSFVFNSYAMFAAFCTYFCMYAFRKPFSVGTYESTADIWGVDYKIIIIIAQVFGYALSKIMGIKIISEVEGKNRAKLLISLILIAELALLGFAAVPAPWNIIFLFMNGLPLGLVWGLVLGTLEGRKTTELLGAGLSASFIVASGAVKQVGKLLLNAGIPEFWMPFTVGILFLPAFAFMVYLLSQLPKPTEEDKALRTERKPMYQKDRIGFYSKYALGLTMIAVVHIIILAYRDFRDNFTREIWDALGLGARTELYSLTEIPIAVFVLIFISLLIFIKNNRLALTVIHAMMAFGSILIGASTLAFQYEVISPIAWMILTGLGLFIAYVPNGCVLFDRIIAATGFVGTAGFMVYVTDAFGYLGSVSLMLVKNFYSPNLSWLEFYIKFSYFTSASCALAFITSMIYFYKKTQPT